VHHGYRRQRGGVEAFGSEGRTALSRSVATAQDVIFVIRPYRARANADGIKRLLWKVTMMGKLAVVLTLAVAASACTAASNVPAVS
jgi:hypothetical protein